jgi:hypothetical protein
MYFKAKFTVIACLLFAIAICVAATLPQQQQRTPPKLVNLKVFPKKVPYRVLDHAMDEWSAALGVKCNFCHVRNTETNKMDFASDAKPEKTAARHMFMMMAKINQKYFQAKKDSLGMVIATGVNCNTCHHGTAHPEIKVMEERHGPGGPPPGAGSPPPGAGTPPPGSQK